jgi:hypothetical protein
MQTAFWDAGHEVVVGVGVEAEPETVVGVGVEAEPETSP